jgi:cytochrome oxidase Cu insertion factor (SCO1/SenC/PrrC family)
MKKIRITILLLLTVVISLCQARASHLREKNGVTFILELDSSITAKPQVIVYESAFYKYGSLLDDHQTFQPVYQHGNLYKFVLPAQNRAKYFTITAHSLPLDLHFVEMFVFEPGDNIKMKIKPAIRVRDFDVVFSGGQASKYTCRQKLKFLQQKQVGIDILNKYKSAMSLYSYQLYYADMIFRLMNFEVDANLFQLSVSVEQKDTAKIAQLRTQYLKNHQIVNTEGIPDRVLFNSAEYLQYRFTDCKLRCYNMAESYNGRVFFDEIKKINDRGLRDRLFVIYFINTWKNLRDDYDDILRDAMVNTTDPACLTKLKAYGHNSKGQVAFNFALQDKDGTIVKLSDFKGKAVFIDFYFTGCTFCKLFYKYVLAEVEPKYAANPDMVFISISVDRYKEQWLKTLQQGEYTSNNTINLYTNGERTNHPLIKYYNILSYPSLMLIDRKGRIFKFASKETRSKEGLEAALNAVLAQ